MATRPPLADGALVALGGASFDSKPLPFGAEELAALEEPGEERVQVASILRGGAWESGFTPPTYMGLETREIAALHEEAFGDDAPAQVLEKIRASSAASPCTPTATGPPGC